MCGIVGYIGDKDVVDVLIDGLSALEYRGYDSAGISVVEDDKITTIKAEGRLDNLKNMIYSRDKINSQIGIGHTRWATHGEPSDVNSHPHVTARLTLVHNGIIENYQEIKKILVEKGYKFASQTDTEVAANLIDSLYENDPIAAIKKASEIIEGSYAFAIIFNDILNKVYATRSGSPLIVALGDNEHFLASDVPAILKYTRNYILLEEGDIVELEKDKITLYDKNLKIMKPQIHEATWTLEQAEKSGYEHFMLKEIYEQPKALLDTVESRIIEGLPSFERDNIDDDFFTGFNRIEIIACGTAMHAGMIGKWLYESVCRINVECSIASEFRYKNPILSKDTLAIFVSQSGETADTLAALRLAKSAGVKTLAIVNVNGSSIAREADYVIYTYAGPEISVASTKAYSVQMAVMYLLVFKTALVRKLIDSKKASEFVGQLLSAIDSVNDALLLSDEIKEYVNNFLDSSSIFFLGRGLDYYQSLEGALKLKEISYIHCEAYAGGELKHGTISLITKDIHVVALTTQEHLASKMISNIKEVVTRGAKVLIFTKKGYEVDDSAYKQCIYLPKLDDMFMPIVTVVALQLLAYHTSVAKGCDVDKPRNLAKSVTVE